MTKKDRYIASIREIGSRLEKGGHPWGDLGNAIAVLKKRLDYFWIGYYFLQEDRLVLGPFQGPPACVFLTLDEGVCAECVRTKRIIVVPDVHAFQGHVACDPRSRSEIVLPLYDQRGKFMGVLDVDSTRMNDFDETDTEYLSDVCQKLSGILSEIH